MRTTAELAADVRDRLEGIRGTEPPSESTVVWQRRAMLLITVVPIAGLILAIVQLWGFGVSWRDLIIASAFYVLSGLGITVGFHRLLTHKSFDAPPWVRTFWAAAGSLAIQGAVIDWVATHRRHHAFSDMEGDPHSPHLDAADGAKGIIRGLFHAHLGWMYVPSGTVNDTWAPDLQEEPGVAAVHRLFPVIGIASFVAPALVGGLWSWSIGGAVTAFVWGALVRIFLLHHITWSINSICHFYGTRPFAARDESRNNLWLSILSFGESWHNAHHAFPASPRHGLRWWEIDPSWITIRLMQSIGMAKNPKLPSPSQLARKRLPRRVAA